ncbi:class I SAM-dependent methyltransferase [Brevibacillus composti]|uniref:Class I SAM-dependent methyltransferase n=1 Tax=Brevibacillus composti TaxID=2796470 RepID=A0A7T5EHC9_9BACL|nr:class I SAM-dependent methyltransferase [Brevibacillus composti]QQE72649.1 class I SAM-dependent methyltransferase [Brevibacillus composti]QUO39727.1 class I SAM-dependent methyltransferase [Brevibacillus composti]
MSEKRFNPAKLAKLDNPERRKALPPEKLLAMLPINNQDAILDIGAGTGYFAIPAAKITKGTVYALDVAPQMLAVLQERVEEAGVANVQYVEGVIEEIPLPDQLVEHVIASLVLHEVEPLDRGLQEIYRLLKPGGTCFCLEWEKKETEQGPPLDHRIGSSELAEAFASAGFEIVARHFPTDAHYILVARKSE